MKYLIPFILSSVFISTSASVFASEANDLCASGKNQSPINIDTKKTLNVETKGVKFNYGLIKPQSFKNTGELLQVNVDKGSNIKVDEIEFELQSLNFHIPSEHTLNEKHFPMEIQFIHKSKDNQLATVSMMVVPGRPDRTLRKLLQQLPQNSGESTQLVANALRNIEMKKKFANYYRYSGSDTSPSCTEGVRWFIMKNNLTFSAEQYQMFKKALGQDNNRPVQALNARMITE